MRSILEQAVIAHLNGEADKAQDLFHQFIVTRARQIHESMRNGEDPLVEGWEDQITSEEYFNEGELDELDALEDDNVDGDMGAETADLDAVDGDEMAADDLGDDMGVDGEDLGDDDMGGDDLGGEETDLEALESRIEDMEAELNELLAKFDDDMGGEEATDEINDDMGDDMGGDEFAGDDFGSDEDEELPMESVDGEDEDFADLDESVTSELEKINVTMADGTEVAAGKKISQNDKSGLPQKNAAARQGGSPINLKSSTHKGFEREAAPSVASMKKRRNNVDKATSAQSAVAAPSNKKEATEVGASGKKVSTQTKSPVVAAKDVQK